MTLCRYTYLYSRKLKSAIAMYNFNLKQDNNRKLVELQNQMHDDSVFALRNNMSSFRQSFELPIPKLDIQETYFIAQAYVSDWEVPSSF